MNDIMILKKKFRLISLKTLYTVVIHTRIQYIINNILPMGGRISLSISADIAVWDQSFISVKLNYMLFDII